MSQEDLYSEARSEVVCAVSPPSCILVAALLLLGSQTRAWHLDGRLRVKRVIWATSSTICESSMSLDRLCLLVFSCSAVATCSGR